MRNGTTSSGVCSSETYPFSPIPTIAVVTLIPGSCPPRRPRPRRAPSQAQQPHATSAASPSIAATVVPVKIKMLLRIRRMCPPLLSGLFPSHNTSFKKSLRTFRTLNDRTTLRWKASDRTAASGMFFQAMKDLSFSLYAAEFLLKIPALDDHLELSEPGGNRAPHPLECLRLQFVHPSRHDRAGQVRLVRRLVPAETYVSVHPENLFAGLHRFERTYSEKTRLGPSGEPRSESPTQRSTSS